MAVQGQFFSSPCSPCSPSPDCSLGARVVAALARPAVIRAIVGLAVLTVAVASFAGPSTGWRSISRTTISDTRSRAGAACRGPTGDLVTDDPRAPDGPQCRRVLRPALIVSCGWWIDGGERVPGADGAGFPWVRRWRSSGGVRGAGEGAWRENCWRPMPEVSRAMAGARAGGWVDRLLAVPVAPAVADLLPAWRGTDQANA